MDKKLILVTSPPACGKTYVAKALAHELQHIVYLDKDTLIGRPNWLRKVQRWPSSGSRPRPRSSTSG